MDAERQKKLIVVVLAVGALAFAGYMLWPMIFPPPISNSPASNAPEPAPAKAPPADGAAPVKKGPMIQPG